MRHRSAGLLTIALSLHWGCAETRSSNTVQAASRADRLVIEHIPEPLYIAPLMTPAGEIGQVLFHLNFYNRGRKSVRLRYIELTSLGANRVLLTTRLEPSLLKLRLRAMPWIVVRSRETLAAVHRWRTQFRAPKGNTIIPAGHGVSLTHHLIIDQSAAFPDAIRCTVATDQGQTSHLFPVRRFRQHTPLRLPIEGRWQVMAGHRPDEQHASPHMLSESFAYDFTVMAANSLTFVGDPHQRASYPAYGRNVVASAAGTVVLVNDEVAENESVGLRPGWQSLLRRPLDIGGNLVVLRHSSTEYSAYLHLQPKILVRPGQQVQAGTVLGRCGNSGNSFEPHLHFQLQDGPDPLTAHGLPARFGAFTLHYGHRALYVAPDHAMPLPSRLVIEAGRATGATDVAQPTISLQ